MTLRRKKQVTSSIWGPGLRAQKKISCLVKYWDGLPASTSEKNGSHLSHKIKFRLFQSTIESILVYGSEAWTINKSFSKKIDWCYTKMLRMVKGVP